ncbi:EAL domain-containing protein [Baekduia sp. Peel2402]|uniref:EAL domain-containing protein n=1 Tax=Baekduia sp. Peel2402 TaxID=3458296 RepID=UPI00403EB5AC
MTDTLERSPAAGHSGHPERFWTLATDLFATVDADGMLHAINPAWERVLGRSFAELSSEPLTAFLHPDDVALTARQLALATVAGSRIEDLANRWRHADGSYRTLAWSGASDGTTWSVVGRDVTGRRRAIQERRALEEDVVVQAGVAIASAESLLAARNHLAAVTDSMGEGLLALDGGGRITLMNQAAEELLGWTLRQVVGRVMHDLVHYRHADGSHRPRTDSPILAALRDGVTVRVEDDVFTCRDGRELPTAYTAAPLATADGLGGCVVVFSDATAARDERRELRAKLDALGWVGRVQQVLREDRLVLFAQPILDLRTGTTSQSELLLRIREPDGSISGPGPYLKIAEEHGLIGEIDRWVIRQGVELAAGGMPVELNVSGGSISDPGLVTHIASCLAETGADPALLVFEITETALIEDQPAGRRFAECIHALGCKLALDDFGTGYGGFTYIKQIPVDYLKIDIEFVQDLCRSTASVHVVKAVVNLARGFGLETVAEGVEDAETLARLKTLGVDYAQGFHIARPGPLPAAAGSTKGGNA